MPTTKRWLLAPKAPPEHLRRYPGIGLILAQILYNRGFDNPEEARRFLVAKNVGGNCFSMKGMNQAVARLRQAIKQRELIIVYGDFDADGVTSTVLLMQVLQALNAVVKPYIPHRVDEGYGLNSEALLKLAKAGAKVVLTVDCGIRSVQEVEDGKAAGLDIIITDHHSIGPEIPDAYAVINPKQEDCKYPEDMLAGVGVAYKVAEALLTVALRMDRQHAGFIVEDLLDLVALGTVADLAPLNRAENRELVRRGLEVLNEARRPGIRALMEVAGIERGKVNAMSIGFALGPRINAAGRLESAMIAYNLLSATDPIQAQKLAEQVHILNSQRQDVTREAQYLIRSRIEAAHEQALPLIFASDTSFRPGIVGLVAGRLTEEFYRPTVVMELGEMESRASCRSIPQFDITRALDQCADLLVRHGGHAQAAGFTILNQNIPIFKERLMQIASDQLDGQELIPTLEIDVEADINQLTEDLLEEIAQLEPTGHLNATPVFVTRNVYALERRVVGKEGQHLKLKIARAGRPPLDAIGFGLGAWATNMPERIDVAYQLEMNEWNGHRTLQLNLQDIRPAADD
jgi:single-stranded-DNA-specific exonuclease